MAGPRRIAVPILIVLFVLGVGLVLLNRTDPDALAHDGCDDAYVGVAPDTHINPLPYGKVLSCRELRREGHTFGQVEVTAYLLLNTERGLAVVRVDYRDLDAARFYRAAATELGPDDVLDGLSVDEARRHRDDVERRGGVRAQEWTLRAGDG